MMLMPTTAAAPRRVAMPSLRMALDDCRSALGVSVTKERGWDDVSMAIELRELIQLAIWQRTDVELDVESQRLKAGRYQRCWRESRSRQLARDVKAAAIGSVLTLAGVGAVASIVWGI